MLNQLSFKGQWRQYQRRVLDKAESFMDDGKDSLGGLLLVLVKQP
ncbi:MAG: hypothetical protein ACLTYH_08940 [Streptococcus salivarius]